MKWPKRRKDTGNMWPKVKMGKSAMEFESKLVPIMREGVEVIKMICFRKLSTSLSERYPQLDKKTRGLLTGAVINRIFGATNNREPFASFCLANHVIIETEIKALADNLGEMRIPLTDALRMQTLCDKMDNIEDIQTIAFARDVGLLIEEREIPLPHNFMEMVRRIGKAFGLIIPPLPA